LLGCHVRGSLAALPVGGDNSLMEQVKPTKQRLIEAGLRLLLEHGYNSLGIQALLNATGLPKGSFYHHFKDKQDFALQVTDAYITGVHGVLDACLMDTRKPPLARVRSFFEFVMQKYRDEGYLGCLMGGLGQELSGTSDVFRQKIEWCFLSISERIASCFEEAKARGDIPSTSDPKQMADLLVDCWEGAALRSRLRKNPLSLTNMLDFYIQSWSINDRPRQP
jgi:TetR/AcrR family transcriptional regulator, transcriptional repressor for nem operon